jgi:hypothetical protein
MDWFPDVSPWWLLKGVCVAVIVAFIVLVIANC